MVYNVHVYAYSHTRVTVPLAQNRHTVGNTPIMETSNRLYIFGIYNSNTAIFKHSYNNPFHMVLVPGYRQLFSKESHYTHLYEKFLEVS